MKRTIFAILIISMCCSCSSVRFVSQDNLPTDEMNDDLQGRSATIKLKGGQWAEGEIKGIYENTIRYYSEDTGEATTVPVQDVQMIRTINHARGGWDGFKIGAAGSLGLTLGLVSIVEYGPYGYIVLAGGMVIGGLTGGIIGGMVGAKEIYLIVPGNHSDAELNSLETSEELIEVRIDTTINETTGYLTFIWQGEEISIRKTDITKIERFNQSKVIYLRRRIYDSKFGENR